MHVYISVDMEGIGGIATLNQTIRGNSGYPRAQVLMTRETNAAVQGAFDAGATRVTVNDSHGTMDNLLHEELDPRVRLVFGSPKAQCMAEGLDESVDVALFVGYHAPAGHEGVLAHTFSGYFTEVRINGRPASEMTVNALWAASMGVSVGLVTGDDVICGLAALELPGVEVVPVKVAHGWSAADAVAPSAAREAIRDGAFRAVSRAAEFAPVALPATLRLEIDLPTPLAADLAALMPLVERVSGRTVGVDLTDPADVLGVITVCYELAASAQRTLSSVLARV